MRPSSRLCAALLVATSLHASLDAHAQQPASQPAPSDASATPPDIVRLKNGGYLRGTVLEAIPNDHVDLMLPTGERRRIPWVEVEHVGAAPAAGSQGSPAATSDVPLTFEGSGADELRLHVRAGESALHGVAWAGGQAVTVSGSSRAYLPLCVAPCTTRVPTGVHRMGVSARGGPVLEAVDGIRIEGPSRIHAEYISHTGMRTAGALILLTSLGVGTTLFLLALRNTADNGGLYVGGSTVVAGSLLSLPFLLTRDEVQFHVSPLALTPPRVEVRPAAASALPPGLALTATF